MKRKISDLIIEYIASLDVKHAFLISGGGNIHLLDSITHNSKIEYICNHHEQACAMAAESYGRVGGNIGVCITTLGPASTNIITGVMAAWTDSIATLYISGQVKVDNMLTGTKARQIGIQEVDIVEIARPITKYSVVVNNPLDVMYHLKKAVFLAKSGRPGPVLLDIPSDIQAIEIEVDSLRNFDPNEEGLVFKDGVEEINKIPEVVSMLINAKRPLVFAGHGIRLAHAEKNFLKLVEMLNIPVVTSMSAHDLIPSDHPLFTGRPGVFGDRAGNFAVQSADLLISIGARHHLWNIGYNYKDFARNAKKVIVDIDVNELTKKTVSPDLPINMDAKSFIQSLSESIDKIEVPNSWLKSCQNWRSRYPVVLPEYKNEKNYVNSYYFTDVLSSMLNEDEIILTGVGTSFTGTLQSFKFKKNQRLHCSVGCASMGYDLPSAIGAWFSTKKDRIILLTGDGSIMMNIQELQTISYHKIPVKIFLLNNSGYLAIKNSQNSFFNSNLAAVDNKTGISFPSFEKVADTFGIGYIKINDHSNMNDKIAEALNYDGPVICDINMSPDQPLIPKVYSEKLADGTMSSRPIEDMFPFLDRQEFIENMEVSSDSSE